MIEHRMNDNDALCPFFRYHTREQINCEGVVPETTARMDFTRAGMKKQHYQTYCCNHYQQCEMYGAVICKYEEGKRVV